LPLPRTRGTFALAVECPEENEIVDYVRGDVDESRRGVIERHLDACPACLQVVGELVRIFQQPVDPDQPRGTSGSSPALDATFGPHATLLDTSTTLRDEPLVDPMLVGLRDGAKLGRYVILARVGSGGMGVVFSAYDPELDRKVAIKLLRGSPGGSGPKELAEQRARLLREAQAMAKLSHANVITVHDVGTIDDQVFVAMEFVDGTTLGGWLRERRRTWHEVLPVLLAAGRGLAAAHVVGLVHRDFKPDNVLLGKDAHGAVGHRVLVTDFGLARPAAGKTDTFAAVGTMPGVRVLGLALTQTGALVGTPAYMAPEQLAGERSDALTDQFSFCVALYEGLYGERPFAGRVLAELMSNVYDGRVKASPTISTVPRWLRRALLRGLSVRPEDRYPSMDALLAQLERNPWRRWQRVATIAIPTALLAAGVLATQRDEAPAATYCEDVRDKLVGVWDDDRREAIATAFAATDKPYAADTEDAVRRRLDPYAEQWVQLQTQACRDEVEGARPQAVLTLQMACLDRRRESLRALAELLGQADVQTLERAIDAATALPALEICGDLDALTSREGMRDDAVDPALADGIDRQLARAKVLRDAARYGEARELARGTLLGAREAGYRGAIADALLLIATCDDLLGELPQAESDYHEALSAALGSGHTENVVRVSLGLIWVTGEAARPMIEPDRWYAHGKAALERMGGDPELDAELERAVAIAYIAHGEVAPAETHVRASLRIREQAFGADHTSMGAPWGALGQLLAMKGDYVGAREAFQRSLELNEREYGPAHPNIAASLDNLGSAYGESGMIAEALPLFERAMAIRTAALGDQHPTSATSHHNIATALSSLGRLDEARGHARRELEILERLQGPDDPAVASALEMLAGLQGRAGDQQDALRNFARAYEIAVARLGEDRPSTAHYAYNYAGALLVVGRDAEALALHERALANRIRMLGEDHPKVGMSHAGVAQALLALGRADEALDHAERAVASITTTDSEPSDLATARFALARALWESVHGRDRKRALVEADAALELISRAPGDVTAPAIASWIAEHR
jgi:eukaryotic-like serine/threonine-protein kinase